MDLEKVEQEYVTETSNVIVIRVLNMPLCTPWEAVLEFLKTQVIVVISQRNSHNDEKTDY